MSTDSIRVSQEAEYLPTNELFEALGTTIEPELLVEALTHRSFAHEHPGTKDYERLEFLGDAVLEFVVTETLFKKYPDRNEGMLAKVRAKAVSEEKLSEIARDTLHAAPMVLVGNGERARNAANKDSIMCDIFESLIGAVYVQYGIDKAREVIHRLVDLELTEVSAEGPSLDWKTSLIVRAQELGLGRPTYRMAVSGPQYALHYTAYAILGEEDPKVYGHGEGSSTRKAQIAAAEDAWHALEGKGKSRKKRK